MEGHGTIFPRRVHKHLNGYAIGVEAEHCYYPKAGHIFDDLQRCQCDADDVEPALAVLVSRPQDKDLVERS